LFPYVIGKLNPALKEVRRVYDCRGITKRTSDRLKTLDYLQRPCFVIFKDCEHHTSKKKQFYSLYNDFF